MLSTLLKVILKRFGKELTAKKNANSLSKVRTFGTLGSSTQDKVRTFFSVLWYIETIEDDFGKQKFSLNRTEQVKEYPFLEDANFRLTPLLIVNSPKIKEQKKEVVKKPSRAEQRKKFTQLLDEGKVKSRADLARRFGVSRAWVTKVLNN
jgi:hypothetical protein